MVSLHYKVEGLDMEQERTLIFNVLSNTVGIPPFNQVCNQLYIKNLSEEGDKINTHDMIVISFLCVCISLLFHGKKIKE